MCHHLVPPTSQTRDDLVHNESFCADGDTFPRCIRDVTETSAHRMPSLIFCSDMHYSIGPFYWWVGIIVVIGCHVDLFVTQIRHDSRITSRFHLVFVPDYSETAPFFRDRSLHPHKLFDHLYRMSVTEEILGGWGRREYLSVTAVFICVLQERH